jgi:hypothetical protein
VTGGEGKYPHGISKAVERARGGWWVGGAAAR